MVFTYLRKGNRIYSIDQYGNRSLVCIMDKSNPHYSRDLGIILSSPKLKYILESIHSSIELGEDLESISQELKTIIKEIKNE